MRKTRLIRFNNLSARLVIATVVGFLLAGAGTHITYTCPPFDGAEGCVSFAKAIDNPKDLLHNKQDSLVHFSTYFLEVTLVSFIPLEMIALLKKRKVQA